MGEILSQVETGTAPELVRGVGTVTVLEALAENAVHIGPSRSNQSTPQAADADDQ